MMDCGLKPTRPVPATRKEADVGEVWCIRHGESDSNAGNVTTHPALSNLTEAGRVQAARVPLAFDRAPDRIVVSSYIRTAQTAAFLRQRFPHVPCEEWPVHEFTLLAPARYEGTTNAFRRPLMEAYWERNDPQASDLDQAETFAAFTARVQAMVTRLRGLPGFTAVFSHGLFIRTVLWQLITSDHGSDALAMRRLRAFKDATFLPNCAILKLRFNAPDAVWCSGFVAGHQRD